MIAPRSKRLVRGANHDYSCRPTLILSVDMVGWTRDPCEVNRALGATCSGRTSASLRKAVRAIGLPRGVARILGKRLGSSSCAGVSAGMETAAGPDRSGPAGDRPPGSQVAASNSATQTQIDGQANGRKSFIIDVSPRYPYSNHPLMAVSSRALGDLTVCGDPNQPANGAVAAPSP